jgi:tRNA(Ile)-lysidine synthase
MSGLATAGSVVAASNPAKSDYPAVEVRSHETPRDPAIAAALGPVRAAIERIPVDSRRILVACSGGADSVAALGLLLALRSSLELVIAVGHVDHGLREASSADAAKVAALADRLELVHRCTRLSLAPGPGIPARAREARRNALIDQARDVGATTIVLAHTATDQAETMIMHLARGAGLDGLSAMPVHQHPWLRPLLDLTRAQTRGVAERLEFGFVDDPGNDDPTALRVWLRTCVLPRLRDHNPQVDRALVGLARQARDADEALDQWASREVESRRDPTDSGRWSLAEFDRLPRAVRSRVLRRIAEHMGVDLEQLRRRTLDELEAAALAVAEADRRRRTEAGAASPAPRGWDLAPKLRVTVDRNGVWTGSDVPPTDAGNH